MYCGGKNCNLFILFAAAEDCCLPTTNLFFHSSFIKEAHFYFGQMWSTKRLNLPISLMGVAIWLGFNQWIESRNVVQNSLKSGGLFLCSLLYLLAQNTDVMDRPPTTILDHEDKAHYRDSTTENFREPEFLMTLHSCAFMLWSLPLLQTNTSGSEL